MSDIPALNCFLVDEFLPDTAAHDIPPDLDLFASGVIDSLGLLKIIVWIERDRGVEVQIDEMVPENFSSITRIAALIERNRIATTPSAPASPEP